MDPSQTLWKQIEKQSLAQTALERLLEVIRDGGLKPGDTLPSQHQLADRLAISRPVLREAMQALAALGVVEIRPGSGCYVRDTHASSDVDALFDFFTHEGAIEVLDARMVVEVELAALAATRATQEDIVKVEEILVRLKRALARRRPVAQITSEFHQALTQSGHNRPLYRMAQLLSQARLVQGMRVEHALPDIAADEYKSHRRLLDAVLSGDPDQARAEMRRHLEIAHGWEDRVNSLRSQLEASRSEGQ